MNATSHLQTRPILRAAVVRIALLVCAVFLFMASLGPAAPIDQSFQYDALNRLTAAGAATYQHDAAGNLLQMTAPATPSLFVTPSTSTVAYGANSATTVSLTANVSWTAGSNQTWLTVSPASGTTGSTLTLTATTQNPATSTRSAIVTITGGSLTSQVTVTQDGAPPPGTLVLTPTSLTIPSSAATGSSFSVTTNGVWSAGSNQPWLTLTASGGTGNGTVTFDVTANNTAALRTAIVTVTGSALTAQYTLNQQAPTSDDHGGSIAAATIIPTTASSATGTLTASDEDFFRVTVPGPGILIAWSESSIDTYGYLYNSAGTQVDEDNDSDLQANFRVSAAVAAGTYYIRLKGNAANTVGTYTLRTRFIPSAEPIQVSFLEKATNDMNLGFTGIAGTTYYILGSDDLKTWTQITTLTGTGAENYITLTGQGTQPRRYFRVSTAPPAPPAPIGFALIPAGEFQMGDALDGTIDAPVHAVSTSAFYMANYEVTKALWDEVRTWGLTHGYADLPVGEGKGEDHPAQVIDWYSMVKWCNARSEKEGFTPCYYTAATQATTAVYRLGSVTVGNAMVKWTANGYRLPTEAEWEKAARGGLIGKRFPWGDTITQSQANYYSTDYPYESPQNVGYHPSFKTGATPYTSPVGSFPASANGYGLFDIAGNVWEWCWDWYGTYPTTLQTDPQGAPTGTARVARGGSWVFNSASSRVTYRYAPLPTHTSTNIGFRVARSATL